MQFAHPRLLITSSLPLRFSSLSSLPRRFLRFSVLPLVPPFLLPFLPSPPVFRFSAGPSVFPPVPRRFSVLLQFPSLSALSQARCTAGGSRRCCDRGRNRGSLGGGRCGRCGGGRCGSQSGGRYGACVELYRILGFSGYSCGANPSNGRIFSRAVPHFAQNMVQLDRGCTDMICFIYICRRLHSISKEMWGKNVM